MIENICALEKIKKLKDKSSIVYWNKELLNFKEYYQRLKKFNFSRYIILHEDSTIYYNKTSILLLFIGG